MNISITPDMEGWIDKKVKSGLYNSVSEVVREGLRLLIEQDELKALKLKSLKKALREGYDSASNGQAEVWSLDRVKAKVKAKARHEKKSKGKSVSRG